MPFLRRSAWAAGGKCLLGGGWSGARALIRLLTETRRVICSQTRGLPRGIGEEEVVGFSVSFGDMVTVST